MTGPKQVLLVEDHALIRYGIRSAFAGTEFAICAEAASINEAKVLLAKANFDVVVLDLNLPDGSGHVLTEIIRKMKISVPIIILSAKDGEIDKVVGLELGADDYVNKPISTKVLVSRVNALFRRIANNDDTDGKTLTIGNMVIDPVKFMVIIKGEEIALAKKEFELLYLLASKQGRVFLRNEILSQIWGKEVIVGDRTIDVHVRKIRQKLGIDCVTTVKGVGYKFEM